ncbi:hypothetical protein PoB_003038200 [Plakobranchus ocellatus]|uniref:Uncharacterized protein n=1 Tax=Plakobranchus ocellatus TaxID=259542 RepID=A0AAV4A9J5_9GAST|nr:hypothetical protein PoB_003038200 [Plakobranchus ocellatus]
MGSLQSSSPLIRLRNSPVTPNAESQARQHSSPQRVINSGMEVLMHTVRIVGDKHVVLVLIMGITIKVGAEVLKRYSWFSRTIFRPTHRLYLHVEAGDPDVSNTLGETKRRECYKVLQSPLGSENTGQWSKCSVTSRGLARCFTCMAPVTASQLARPAHGVTRLQDAVVSSLGDVNLMSLSEVGSGRRFLGITTGHANTVAECSHHSEAQL